MLRVSAGLFLVALLSFGQSRSHAGEYALILKDTPVAQASHSRAELMGAAAKTRAAAIRSAQSPVIAELKRRGIAVTRATQILANAVFVHTDAKTAAGLAGIRGVARVQYLPPVTPDLTTALGLENVSAAWSAVGGVGNAGAGMKIGIIDSGIDQTHPGFQDSSLTPPPGFPKGDPNFTNNKVIVARSYIAPQTVNFDSPDDLSPRDRIGHGTAIAMIAAGVQNTGPLGTIQGVAPKAFLGNYKIFGSPGVNTFLAGDFSTVAAALADAISDGMDVVTLAVNEGDPAQFGPLDSDPSCGGSCDVRVQVVENAVQNGLVVVTSAGNSNGTGLHSITLSSIHTPGTAPDAITVGASTNSHVIEQTLTLGNQTFLVLLGDGPHPSAPVTGPVVDVTQLGNDGLACTALPAGSLTGKIALVLAGGGCVYSDKINFAQNAGAIAVVIYQSGSAATLAGGALTDSLGAQNTGIPAALTSAGNGSDIKHYLASNPGAIGTLDPAPTMLDNAPNRVALFSSRGPSIGNFANPVVNTLKPELVAVGGRHLYCRAEIRSEWRSLQRNRLYGRFGHELCGAYGRGRGRAGQAEESEYQHSGEIEIGGREYRDAGCRGFRWNAVARGCGGRGEVGRRRRGEHSGDAGTGDAFVRRVDGHHGFDFPHRKGHERKRRGGDIQFFRAADRCVVCGERHGFAGKPFAAAECVGYRQRETQRHGSACGLV